MRQARRSVALDQLDNYNRTDLLTQLISTQAMTSLNEKSHGLFTDNSLPSQCSTSIKTIAGLGIHVLTNSRLLEKPTVAQLLKNFPTFYGTRRLITVFTRARHWSILSQMNPVHTPSPIPFL
jgi:hypothetical protein